MNLSKTDRPDGVTSRSKSSSLYRGRRKDHPGLGKELEHRGLTVGVVDALFLLETGKKREGSYPLAETWNAGCCLRICTRP